jgi:hypothetical protein
VVRQEVLEIFAAAVHHACAAGAIRVLLAAAPELVISVLTTYGIIHAVVAYVLHRLLIHQNGVFHTQHQCKAVAVPCPDNHNSAEAHHMSVLTVYGNREMGRLAAPATLILEKHGHWNGVIQDCVRIRLEYSAGVKEIGVVTMKHPADKIGGTFKTFAALARPVLHFKLPAPTALADGKCQDLGQKIQVKVQVQAEF